MRNGCRAGKGSCSNTSSAAPAMRRFCSALINAASSTIGPRAVLTSSALGFIHSSAWASTRPRLRSLSTRCTDSTSACSNNCCLLTYVTPTCSARSAVRFSLQAITRMPNTWPNCATRWPMLPKPRIPRVLPCRSPPRPCCHWPARRALASFTRSRVAAMISAQVSSGAACL